MAGRALINYYRPIRFLITGHDVPAELIRRTFAEAARVHDLPMSKKLTLKLNHNNNGYMASGKYAVWTSDVNRNDKPDLNEAFFIKRERDPANPLRQANRRFAGKTSGRTKTTCRASATQ